VNNYGGLSNTSNALIYSYIKLITVKVVYQPKKGFLAVSIEASSSLTVSYA